MKKIRIFFNYKHISKPWGGANNFIRALYQILNDSGEFEFADNIEDDYDILFMNQLGMGPANDSKKIGLKDIKRIKEHHKKKIIVRVVNLNKVAHPFGIRNFINHFIEDINLVRLINLADLVIFQSLYQKAIFQKYGYKRTNNVVIHNGADSKFRNDDDRPKINGDKLCIVSSTSSPRATKRHDLIARMSDMKDVTMVHMGNWPDNVDKKKVEMRGVLSIDEMKEVYRNTHYLFHPAIKDPCPNVIFEAILSGLPVVYNDVIGSSSEIIKENGFSLNEDDLRITVNKCKEMYSHLTENVKKTKNHYSIERAALEYIEVLKKICIPFQ
jgi:glycosyltransferase involved in cell wall biosynthesis